MVLKITPTKKLPVTTTADATFSGTSIPEPAAKETAPGNSQRHWTEYAEELSRLLGLKHQPVAVTYGWQPAAQAIGGRHRVCDALLLASHGNVIDLTDHSCSCPGGTWHLGLAEYPTGVKDRVAKDFLVNREKIYASVEACQASRQQGVPPTTGLGDHIILSPLSQAEFLPDTVLLICNPEQACRVVTLDGFRTGASPRIQMSGSTCYQAITYPVVSGELNVSLMDYTSRHIPGYTPEDLLVSIPYPRLLSLMRNTNECAAGKARVHFPHAALVQLSAHYNLAVPLASVYIKAEQWVNGGRRFFTRLWGKKGRELIQE